MIEFTVIPPKAGEDTSVVGDLTDVSFDSDKYNAIRYYYAESEDALDDFDVFSGVFQKKDYYSYALITPAEGEVLPVLSADNVEITGATFIKAEPFRDYYYDAETGQYVEEMHYKVYYKVSVTEDAVPIGTMNLQVKLPVDGDRYFEPAVTTKDQIGRAHV